MFQRALRRQLTSACSDRFRRYTACSNQQRPRCRRARVRAAQERTCAGTASRPGLGSAPAPRAPDDPRQARKRTRTRAHRMRRPSCPSGAARSRPTGARRRSCAWSRQSRQTLRSPSERTRAADAQVETAAPPRNRQAPAGGSTRGPLPSHESEQPPRGDAGRVTAAPLTSGRLRCGRARARSGRRMLLLCQ
jgi:hypothetical protein